MTPFSDIDAKRLKRFRTQMDEFIDATVRWNDTPQWKSWFAWRPVRVKGQWCWLKKVYRKEIPKTYVNHDDWTRYEYGDVFDVLKNG